MATKAEWTSALTNDVYSAIEAMTINDLDYSNQYNLAQASALFQHQTFITINAAAKETFKPPPRSVGQREFTDAINNVANMEGANRPGPIMKQQHGMALRLLCLIKDAFEDYSIPKKLNPSIKTILKSGMKANGPMTLN
jgi:hypothetical protein